MLAIGDRAPYFALIADNNQQKTLDDFQGQQIVLYFYPKDNTPGCTKEACEFRDAWQYFTDKNTVIIGVSKDSPTSHQQFKAKYNLPFMLLSDPDATVCTDYAVIKPKSIFGKSFLGIQRTTFLIDQNGYIKNIWPQVTVKAHAQAVLKMV
jgi:peroxiredoxin Q/BCP